jgi:hypothetical protein
MPFTRETKQQVSWHDVWLWCADLEKIWHCYVQFQEFRVRKEGFAGVWDVRIVAKWLGVGGAVTREEAISVQWPNVNARTQAGQYLALIVELDRKLTELEAEKRSGAHGQDRFA